MGCACSNSCCPRSNRDQIEIAITTRGQMELRTADGEKRLFIIPKVVVTNEYNAIEVIYMPERVAANGDKEASAEAGPSPESSGVKKRPFSLPGLEKQTSAQKSSSSSSSSGSSGGSKKKQKPEKKQVNLLDHGRRRIEYNHKNYHRLGQELTRRRYELDPYL